MNKEKLVKYIKSTLDDRTLWEQLAEESSELSKAALKFIRAAGYSNNPTPISETNAYTNVKEELQDVLCVCRLLGLNDIEPNDEKLKRWANRIAGKLDTPKGEVTAKFTAKFYARGDVYKCSNCGEDIFKPTNYCPNCGRYISKKL